MVMVMMMMMMMMMIYKHLYNVPIICHSTGCYDKFTLLYIPVITKDVMMVDWKILIGNAGVSNNSKCWGSTWECIKKMASCSYHIKSENCISKIQNINRKAVQF